MSEKCYGIDNGFVDVAEDGYIDELGPSVTVDVTVEVGKLEKFDKLVSKVSKELTEARVKFKAAIDKHNAALAKAKVKSKAVQEKISKSNKGGK